MRLRFPCILSKQRTEEGKKIRRLYKNDVGVPYQEAKGYAPRMDGIAMTVTTFQSDNNIIYLSDMRTRPEYKPNPTKDDLRDYFAPRVAVRKMTCAEAFRLQDVSDEDIEKIQSYPFKSYEEKETFLKSKQDQIEGLEKGLKELKAERKGGKWYVNNVECTKEMLGFINATTKEIKSLRKELSGIKGQFIAKTKQFALAGNSITVAVLFHIFRTLFIPGQPGMKTNNKPNN